MNGNLFTSSYKKKKKKGSKADRKVVQRCHGNCISRGACATVITVWRTVSLRTGSQKRFVWLLCNFLNWGAGLEAETKKNKQKNYGDFELKKEEN